MSQDAKVSILNKSVAEKIAQMSKLTAAARNIFQHQVQQQFPNLTQREILQITARRIYRNDQIVQEYLRRDSSR